MAHNTKQVNNSCASSVFPSSVTMVPTGSQDENQSKCESFMSQDCVMSRQNNQNAAVISSAEALVKLLNRTLYPIVQENGQRRYGPPPDWKGEPPARGCEVFIGKIPRDCFEDELVPIFEKAGKIYMFRLMMDFTGTNRGYGFCVYWTREETRRAVGLLNNFEIRTDKALGVCLSVDNCRLFVGGIPKSKTKEEIYSEMRRVTEGVRDVIAYPSVADKTKNRGFAFVEYESHKAAAMARRKLIPGRIQLWGQQIAVDWAEPEREVTEEVMCTVRILYVRNLMLSTTEETLRSAFVNASGGPPDCVERVKKLKDYAFVHFKDRCYADIAMRLLNNTQIDNSWVEVSWAKPADKSEQKSKSSLVSPNSPLTILPSTHNSIDGIDTASSLQELLNSNNQIFIDSAHGISYIGAPIHTIQQPPNFVSIGNTSPSKPRPNRRNAAGSRSIANREKRNNELSDIQELPGNTWSSTPIVGKPEWDGYNVKYQCVPTQMLFPGVNFISSNISNQSVPTMNTINEEKTANDNSQHLQEGSYSSEPSFQNSNNLLNSNTITSSVPQNSSSNIVSTTTYNMASTDPIYYNFMTHPMAAQCTPHVSYIQPPNNSPYPSAPPIAPTPTTYYTHSIPQHTYSVLHPHLNPLTQHNSNTTSTNNSTQHPLQLQPYPIIMPLTLDYNIDNSAYIYPHQSNPTLIPFSLPPNQ